MVTSFKNAVVSVTLHVCRLAIASLKYRLNCFEDGLIDCVFCLSFAALPYLPVNNEVLYNKIKLSLRRCCYTSSIRKQLFLVNTLCESLCGSSGLHAEVIAHLSRRPLDQHVALPRGHAMLSNRVIRACAWSIRNKNNSRASKSASFHEICRLAWNFTQICKFQWCHCPTPSVRL